MKANVNSSNPTSDPREKVLGAEEECPVTGPCQRPALQDISSFFWSTFSHYLTESFLWDWSMGVIIPTSGTKEAAMSLKQLGKLSGKARAQAPCRESRALFTMRNWKCYRQTYSRSRNRDLDAENKCVDTEGKRRRGRRRETGVGTDTELTLDAKQVINEMLLDGSGNSTLCWAKREGNPKNGEVCTRAADSLCCAEKTNTILKSNHTPEKFKNKTRR